MTTGLDIIELADGGDPPNTGQWLMVVLHEQRPLELKRHARGFTLMAPPSMEAQAMTEAQAVAKRERISAIYVRRDGNVGDAH